MDGHSENVFLSALRHLLQLEIVFVEKKTARAVRYSGELVDGEDSSRSSIHDGPSELNIYSVLFSKEKKVPYLMGDGRLMKAFCTEARGAIGQGFLFQQPSDTKRFHFLTDSRLPSGSYSFSEMGEEALLQLQLNALRIFEDDEAPHLSLLRRIILGKYDVPVEKSPLSRFDTDLDDSQIEAVSRAIALTDRNPFCLIQGPPGTGKTKTIAEIAARLARDGERVLVTSHTNVAVDNALEAMLKRSNTNTSQLMRFGSPLKTSPEMKDILSTSIHDLKSKSVVGATLSKLSMLAGLEVLDWRDPLFSVAIVDESSMATPPLTLCGIMHASTFILVGDHMQLPPVVHCLSQMSKNEAHLAARSLFEHLVLKYPERKTMLEVQYRSHPSIAGFSSKYFYEGRLRSDESVNNKNWTPKHTTEPTHFFNTPETRDKPIIWINTSKYSKHVWSKPVGRAGPSAYNTYEAATVSMLVKEMRRLGLPPEDAFVLTPFRLQALLLRQLLQGEELTITNLLNPESSTVDSFQGKQQSVVVYDFTVTSPWTRALQDHRRLNVALTRAEEKLIIVGAADYLAADHFYNNLWNYFKTNGTVMDSPTPKQLTPELKKCQKFNP